MIDVSSDFNVNLDIYIGELSNKIEEEKRAEEHIEVHKNLKRDDTTVDQNRKIKDLFDTLLLK